jgi:16S rRNA (cytosine1402-N4)-methyltransferase
VVDGFSHLPVMVREVVEYITPVPAGLVVDATVGGAGHARAILDARPDVRVLGIDRDREAVDAATAALAPYGERAAVVHGRFEQVGALVDERGEHDIVGILMDLGVSSHQLDRGERGFSFRHDAPLDMRMDASQPITASDVVNGYSQSDLAAVIAQYGEERFAGRIATAIVAARPIHTTAQLAEIVRDAIPAPARRRGPHPARRTFQAIRMEVNRELPNLAAGLDESVHLLTPGGRILVLAYHSLEDRMVKERFRAWSATEEPGTHRLPVPSPRRSLARVITRRALRPKRDEIDLNPRAESARLRVAERV